MTGRRWPGDRGRHAGAVPNDPATSSPAGLGGSGVRDRLHHALADALPDSVDLNGHPERRLPNTLNVSLAGIHGNTLLSATPDMAVSTGSACHAGSSEPSPVLSAIGLDRDRALGAVRLSVGRWSTVADIDRAAELLATGPPPPTGLISPTAGQRPGVPNRQR